jgi:hypothetical protein
MHFGLFLAMFTASGAGTLPLDAGSTRPDDGVANAGRPAHPYYSVCHPFCLLFERIVGLIYGELGLNNSFD